MANKIVPLLLLALAPSAWAAPETVLYDGKAAAVPSTLTVVPWGAGNGQDSTDVFLFGGHSLKVTTLDLYQGAQIALATPAPLGAGDPDRVFQVTIRPGAATLHYDPRLLPGAAQAPQTPNPNMPGGYPGSGPGGMPPGMGYPGMSPGMNYPGGPTFGRRGRRQRGGRTVPAAEPPAVIPPVTKLRLLFTLADGRQADVLRAVPETSDVSVGQGWYSVNVPLSTLKFGPGADSALKSVTVGGDHYGVFYIGRMRFASDASPITASIDAPGDADPGEEVALRAKAEGGLSNLKYVWSLGPNAAVVPSPTDLSTTDPLTRPQLDANFEEGGKDVTVTLTVSDLDGLKKPVTTTKVIHINPAPEVTQPMGGQEGGPMMPPGGP